MISSLITLKDNRHLLYSSLIVACSLAYENLGCGEYDSFENGLLQAEVFD